MTSTPVLRRGIAGPRARLIAYVYFYFGRTLVAYVPMYSGERSGSELLIDRVIERAGMAQTCQAAMDIRHKLRLSSRVIIPRRTLPHPVVYNG